ncbi:hypothetical protein H6G89_28285 [Oscillatoria sp. FACHB-1407]|uniref:AbiU2 domain-containing protein n=1 Tax=Oscillatoria sp. FACHB-1407 TaxID=2692847 RepID=UPI001686804F|nr:hypothetical protein [Oscillatoria sp. FACHB-1407]MBD2464907.1 hypothetical protein [Oscillatoria sp. FACHB-1407]
MENRLIKVKEYTQAALDTLLITKSQFALLEPLMKSEALANRFNAGLRVQARNIMISTLYVNCSLSLLAISLDSDKRAASICNILRMLEAQDLGCFLRDKFSKTRTIYDLSDICESEREQLARRLEKQESSILKQNFDEIYEHVKKRFNELKDGDVCQRLKDVRDKVHAHKEMVLDQGYPRLRTLEEFGVKVGDLRIFVDAVEELLIKLGIIINESSTSLHIMDKQNKIMAEEFWELG